MNLQTSLIDGVHGRTRKGSRGILAPCLARLACPCRSAPCARCLWVSGRSVGHRGTVRSRFDATWFEFVCRCGRLTRPDCLGRSEEHTSELQSHVNLVCRLLLEKKKNSDARRRLRVVVYQPACCGLV